MAARLRNLIIAAAALGIVTASLPAADHLSSLTPVPFTAEGRRPVGQGEGCLLKGWRIEAVLEDGDPGLMAGALETLRIWLRPRRPCRT